MKLCKDCAHFLENPLFPEGSENRIEHGLCGRFFGTVDIDPVAGKPIKKYDWRATPFISRKSGLLASLFDGSCGKRGRFWKPKA